MGIRGLLETSAAETAARRLYAAVLEQARLAPFYTGLGVPDSLDGRFDMVALHAFLVLHRLKRDGMAQGPVGQSLFDLMFADMDAQLREMGVGDLSVGRKVKQMATGFYGRAAAYEAGLSGPPVELEAALRRNLFGTVTPAAAQVTAMADYVRHQAAHLAAADAASLVAGNVDFLPPVEQTA